MEKERKKYAKKERRKKKIRADKKNKVKAAKKYKNKAAKKPELIKEENKKKKIKKEVKAKKRELKKVIKEEKEIKAAEVQEKTVLQEQAKPPITEEKPKEKAEPAAEKIQAPLVEDKKEILIDAKEILIDAKERKRLIEKYKANAAPEKNKERIEVKDMDSLSKSLKDETSVYILGFLRKKNPAFADKLFLGKTFDSEKELEKNLREEIVKWLTSETDALKTRLSELRRKGGDVNYSDFHIMQMPMKIKLFSASFEVKDFKVVRHLLHKASREVKEAELAFSESKPAD